MFVIPLRKSGGPAARDAGCPRHQYSDFCLLWPGPPSAVYKLAAVGRIQAVTSKELEEELADVLGRPKFKLSPEEVMAFLREVQRITIPVVVTSTFKAVVEDPDDDFLLRLAVDGSAEYLVTGDKPLLRISKYQNIEIVTAAEFLRRFEASMGPNPS